MRLSTSRGRTRSKPWWLRTSESSRITGVMAAVWKAYPFAENAGMSAARTIITGTSHQPRGTCGEHGRRDDQPRRRAERAQYRPGEHRAEVGLQDEGDGEGDPVRAGHGHQRDQRLREADAECEPQPVAPGGLGEQHVRGPPRRTRTRRAAGRPSRSSTLYGSGSALCTTAAACRSAASTARSAGPSGAGSSSSGASLRPSSTASAKSRTAAAISGGREARPCRCAAAARLDERDEHVELGEQPYERAAAARGRGPAGRGSGRRRC